MYLLDTNVISEIRKAARGGCNPAVAAWALSVDPQLLHLSVVSLMELEIGYLRLARRDPRQAEILRRWIDHDVRVAFSNSRLIPIDETVARRCARLHVPDPMPEVDSWIASTALVHDLTVATRNVRDFQNAGVALINPWDF